VPKKAPLGIMLCDCLALLVLSFVVIECARTKKAFFSAVHFCWRTSEFICSPERTGRVHTGGGRAGDTWAEAFVSC
jgi:hypothetical protein